MASSRRGFLAGIIAACAAPAIIKTAGLIMPIKPALVPGNDAVLALMTRKIKEMELAAYQNFSRELFGNGTQPDIAFAGDTFMRALNDQVDYPNPKNVGSFSADELSAASNAALDFYVGGIDRSKHSWWKNQTDDRADAAKYTWRELHASIVLVDDVADQLPAAGTVLAVAAAGVAVKAAVEVDVSRRQLLSFFRGK